jgi:hypothetical protein
MSYMGLPVDLRGVTIRVTYNDGTTRVITDTSRMRTEPSIAVGYFEPIGGTLPATNWIFTGRRSYNLLYSHDGIAFSTDLDIRLASGRAGIGTDRADLSDGRSNNWVIPILRTELEVATAAGNPIGSAGGPTGTGTNFQNQTFLTASGLQITGINSMRQTYYVDDIPNFRGLTAEARYLDGTVQTVPLSTDTVSWVLHPHYDNNDETGTGSLFITVGRHPDYDPAIPQALLNQVNNEDPGVTVVLPLAGVHHITRLGFATPPSIPAFFYWEADVGGVSPTSNWATRSAGTVFSLTFSNGTTRTMPIAEAFEKNQVWFNENPGNINQPPLPTPDTNPASPFYIISIAENSLPGTHFFNNRNPRITYYYRGHRLPHPVPVLTRFQSLSITPEALEVSAQRRDNDFRLATDALGFSRLITVTATYSAFSDPEVTGSRVLIYSHELARANWNGGESFPTEPVRARGRDAIRAENQTIADALADPTLASASSGYTPPATVPNASRRLGDVFTMNFGVNENAFPNPASTYNPANAGNATVTDWGVVDDPRNNGRTRNVVIYYNAPSHAVGGATFAGRAVSANVSVSWSNID